MPDEDGRFGSDGGARNASLSHEGAVLGLRNLCKSYALGPVRVEVLTGVSLTVQPGDLVSIMGPSGCGKSTLMNVAGLLDRPTSGTCLLHGRDVAGMSDDERAETRNAHIGFVFQSFHLLPHLTATQNVGLPLVYRGIPDGAVQKRAREALNRVGMADRCGHLPNQLSGGQQQRVAVARALVGEPAVLLADEPTGALDPATGNEIMELFETLSGQGVAVVVVTHDADVAARCHRQTHMMRGRLMETTPAEPPTGNQPSRPATPKRDSSPPSPYQSPARIRHQLPDADADALALPGHAPSGHLDVPSSTPPVPSGLRGHARRHLDALATKVGGARGRAGTAAQILALAEQLRFNAREASMSLRSVLSRSALALVGIVVGIGAVIAMVSSGQIVREESLKQFRELGTDIVTIRRQFKRVRGRALDIDLADVEGLPLAASAIATAAAAIDWNTSIRYRGQALEPGIAFGVTGAFFDLSKLPVAEGRLLSDLDGHRYYCVVGAGIADTMRGLGAASALGERIRVFGRLCPVVGVLESVPPRAIGRQLVPDDTVFMPIVAAMRAGGGGIREAVARVRDGVAPEQARREVEAYFQRVRPELSVVVATAGQLLARMRSQGQLFTLLLGAIASISLIVGGVGVMNVMLLSVRERRGEIGLRRAVGARRGDVRQQFLIESAALALSGGILGVAVGVAAAWGICRFAGWPFSVSTTAMIVGVVVAVAVGLFFGLYPAYRASKLDPIEALRN